MVAMIVYDLQKYHLEFSLAVVDQVLEDIRSGMEVCCGALFMKHLGS
jgi:regulator of nonsense transcripts 2